MVDDSGARSCTRPPPKSMFATIAAYSPGFVHAHKACMTGSMAFDIMVAGIRTTEPTSCGGKNSGHEAPKIGNRRVMGLGAEEGAAALRGAEEGAAAMTGAETAAVAGRAGAEAHPPRNAQETIAAKEVRMAARTVANGKSSRKSRS